MNMILRTDSELWSPPIWVDFMRIDLAGNLKLDCPGTFSDLKAWDLELEEGKKYVFREADGNDEGERDDVVAVGTAHFDEEENRWVAIDWEPTFHFSDLDEPSRDLYRHYRPENGLPAL